MYFWVEAGGTANIILNISSHSPLNSLMLLISCVGSGHLLMSERERAREPAI